MNTARAYILQVLEREGGYVHDPVDPGGETNMGISKRAFPSEDIAGMTRERAIEIYTEHYWRKAKCHLLPPRIQAIHLDTAVNMGVKAAAKILQRASGVTDDGQVGVVTIEAAQRCLLIDYVHERLKAYEAIILANPALGKYRKGWTARVMSYVE